MLADIIEVKVLNNYTLFLRFEDGVSGEIDIAKIVPFKGIFSELKEKKFFDTVSINPAVGTICWKNGADLAPCVLHDILTEK